MYLPPLPSPQEGDVIDGWSQSSKELFICKPKKRKPMKPGRPTQNYTGLSSLGTKGLRKMRPFGKQNRIKK